MYLDLAPIAGIRYAFGHAHHTVTIRFGPDGSGHTDYTTTLQAPVFSPDTGQLPDRCQGERRREGDYPSLGAVYAGGSSGLGCSVGPDLRK
jgi:hypothetical protein